MELAEKIVDLCIPQVLITDQVFLFQQNQLSQFFAQKHSARVMERKLALRQSWRGRR